MGPRDRFQSTTTTELLDSLKDEQNQDVWSGFDARFRPIIEGVARRLGLPPEDAADIAQETLTVFVRDYRRGLYERGKGRLRTWIISIARHRAIDLLRARGRAPDTRRDSGFANIPSEDAVRQAWEAEEEHAILSAAYEELRQTTKADPTTLRLFELIALQGLSTEAAASECGVSPENARLAKHRMTTRLREIVDRITSVFTTDI